MPSQPSRLTSVRSRSHRMTSSIGKCDYSTHDRVNQRAYLESTCYVSRTFYVLTPKFNMGHRKPTATFIVNSFSA